MLPKILYTLRLPASFLFFFVGVIFGFTDELIIFVIFIIAGTIILFSGYCGVIIKGIQNIRKSFLPKTISITQKNNSKLGVLFEILMRYDFFIFLDKDMRSTILSGSVRTGELPNPVETSKKIILSFVLCVPICVVLTIFCVIISGQLLCTLLLLTPFLIPLFPRIFNVIHFADSSSGYDRDLAYFLSYLHIAHLGKMDLYHSMINIIHHGIFPAIERDAKIIKRWVNFDGVSESVTIDKLAITHANKTFQSFLFAYSDISKSNPPGLDNFIANTARIEFDKVINLDEKEIGKISTIFVFGGIALIMVPALLIMMSFAVPDSDVIGMVSMVIIVTPILFAVLSILMYHKKSDFDVTPLKYSIFGGIISIPCYMVSSDILLSLSLLIAIPCIINGIHVSRQITTTRSTVDGFVPFLRDLIERRKVDSNFVTSMKKIFKYDMEVKYGQFSVVLNNINDTMQVFSDKRHDIFYNDSIKSNKLHMMMFVLQSIFDGGAKSTVSGLERLYSFSDDTIQIKNKIDDTLKLSSSLLLFSPLIFFIVLSAVSALMLSFTERIPEIPQGLSIDASAGIFKKFDVSGILSAMRPAIFVMSICSGVVISRVAYSSFAATLPLGVILLISCIIFAGWDFFFDMISDMISGITN